MVGQKIGYVRVSSDDQNVDRQLDGLELDRVFVDKIPGKSTDRPQLQEMLRFLRDGDHLHVHSMDRLARNLIDLRQLVQSLTSQGVKITFVKESLTFTGNDEPISVLLLSVMGAVAEFERSIIRERQAEGIRFARAKGKYKGRAAALTAAQIEEAKQKAATGVPKAKIARELKICRETLYKYIGSRQTTGTGTTVV
ncbi:transposon Tn501 resolvase [Geobacter sp. OR-1]|uniref:recombinase family protein n=1 Tax=Geobacter sp. OR-1 TaxID=1266765 RepID=UPI000543F111|nr:recombinase family protein [Geobacter sp. OR-1]GAM11323.1 transposon Tn501 resolvase [Geobacter sp. OR-1]